MSKNTLKVSPVQNQSLQDEQNFDQRRFISDIYECEKQKYILEKRYNKLKKDYEHKDPKPAFYNTKFGRNANKNCKEKMHVPDKPHTSGKISSEEVIHGAIIGVIVGIICSVIRIIINVIVEAREETTFWSTLGTIIEETINSANSAYYSEIGAKMATFNTIYNL